MPICTHCSQPLNSLYMRYGKEHIVLSPCPTCTTSYSGGVVFADGYLEHDLTIVIIDLLLAKPQAYRHLLFNRSSIFFSSPPSTLSARKTGVGSRSEGRCELGVVARRFLALSLVDAYVRWFYLCVQPPFNGVETGGMGRGRISGKVARWLGERMPMQAGIFFPSLFTPQASNTGTSWSYESGVIGTAIGAVCSSTPLFAKLLGDGKEAGGHGEMLSTLVSYLNVLAVTLVEGLALHLCVGVSSWVAVRTLLRQQRSSVRHKITEKNAEASSTPANTISTPAHSHKKQVVERNEFTDPLLPSKAILLSQLSPLILLTFVLLWSTKFPRPSTSQIRNAVDGGARAGGLQRGWIVWIIRTFLASLNAGVALGTILPTSLGDGKRGGGRSKRWYWPPMILGAGWTIQSLTSWVLYTLLS